MSAHSQIPLLFLGDGPTTHSGLGRIGRDLALHAAALPQFRVGYLGRGGIVNRSLPFIQYPYQPTCDDQWGAGCLEAVWRDFAGSQRGIIFTVWDPFRVDWLGAPNSGLRDAAPDLFAFLTSGRFDLWGYFAVDGYGPRADGALSQYIADALRGYHRVLAYTPQGRDILAATTGRRDIDWIPHGYHESLFTPVGKKEARRDLQLDDAVVLVTTVMTNQPRKDWGTWAQTARLLKERHPNREYRFRIHTDSVDLHWSLPNLLLDYDLANVTAVTTSLTDRGMAQLYAASDLVFLPSLGEGFGYPLLEALASGIPFLHQTGGPGGAYWAEIFPRGCAEYDYATVDTRWNVSRHYVSCAEYEYRATTLLEDPPEPESLAGLVDHLKWRNLWPSVWRKWFLRGIGE